MKPTNQHSLMHVGRESTQKDKRVKRHTLMSGPVLDSLCHFSYFQQTVNIQMLCLKCQECLQKEPGPAHILHSSLHHPTLQSLKKSIDQGCYVCSRFWEALSAQERDLVSGTSVEPPTADYTVESANDGFLTYTSLNDGKNYGHPGCYLFEVAYNMPSINSAPTGCWRGGFLLEPVKGR